MDSAYVDEDTDVSFVWNFHTTRYMFERFVVITGRKEDVEFVAQMRTVNHITNAAHARHQCAGRE